MLSWLRRMRARRLTGRANPDVKLSEPEIASAVIAGAWLASRDDEEERDDLEEPEPEDGEEDEITESDPWEASEDTDADCIEDEEFDLEWL